MKWRAYQRKLGRPHLRLVRAEPTQGERQARARQRLEAAAGLCVLVVLGGLAVALVLAAAHALPR